MDVVGDNLRETRVLRLSAGVLLPHSASSLARQLLGRDASTSLTAQVSKRVDQLRPLRNQHQARPEVAPHLCDPELACAKPAGRGIG